MNAIQTVERCRPHDEYSSIFHLYSVRNKSTHPFSMREFLHHIAEIRLIDDRIRCNVHTSSHTGLPDAR